MIEVQCPRCLQYWYSRDDVTGRRARLCPACAGKRRGMLHGGAAPFGGAAQLGVFVVVAAFLLVVDGLWMVLTGCWPTTFGRPMLIYGCVLFIPAALWFGVILRRSQWGGEMDWTVHRWPLLIGLTGLACVLAYFSLVHSS